MRHMKPLCTGCGKPYALGRKYTGFSICLHCVEAIHVDAYKKFNLVKPKILSRKHLTKVVQRSTI